MGKNNFYEEVTKNIERMDIIRNMETDELKELIAAYEEGRVEIRPKETKAEKAPDKAGEVDELSMLIDFLFDIAKSQHHRSDLDDFLMAVLI